VANGRDKRKRAARRKAAHRVIPSARPEDPPIVDDPDALVLAPLKPKPHAGAASVALPGPELAEEVDAVSQTKITVGEVAGDPIVDRIKAAFAATAYPGDAAFSASLINEEPDQFRYLRRRSWQDLQLERMPGLSDVLMWLSPEALRYYLPAFLIAAVTLPGIPGTGDVIGFLAPPGRSEPLRSSFFHFVKGLTADQRSVVADCLRHLRIDGRGVFAYWNEMSAD